MTDAGTRTAWQRERGFAIVELVIAMIIVAILMAIVLISTRGNDERARQKAMVAVAQEVFTAATAFNSDFPRIPPNSAQDPLTSFSARSAIRQRLNESGAALPSSPSAETDLGFFTRAGRPYFKAPPANPYGGQIMPLRGSCPAAASARPGSIYVCRPAGRPTAVRVVAFARNRQGATILVYDTTG